MTIWNGITEQGAVVPIQVDAQGRVVVSGGGGVPSAVYGAAKAQATVNSDGTLLSSLNLTCSRYEDGYYRFTFQTPLPNANYQVVFAIREGNTGYMFCENLQTTEFTVSARTTDGFRLNVAFSVVVFDDQPSEVTPLILPTTVFNEVKALRAEIDKLKKDKNP